MTAPGELDPTEGQPMQPDVPPGATHRPGTTRRESPATASEPCLCALAATCSASLGEWHSAGCHARAHRTCNPTRGRSATGRALPCGAVCWWWCAGCGAVSGSVSARPALRLGACRRFGIGGLVGRCARGAPCELCGLGMTLGQSSGRVGCDFCGFVADVQLVNAVKSALKLATAGARQSLP